MEIEEVRRIIRTMINNPAITDEDIDYAWDQRATINGTAEVLWRQLASKYAGLVDVQEGSSSRKLSQLYDQALKMANQYAVADLPGGIELSRPGRTRRIVRDARN